VAERERLTNKERRAKAREERRRKEEQAAARRKRDQMRNGLITFVVVGVIAAVVLQAFLGGPDTIDDAILISSSEAEEAFDAAGCEILADREPLPDRAHFEANQQPNLDTIYPDIRPTHSGPHTVGTHPVTAAARSQISEAATTHNLEHGTIIAWWDPDEIGGSTAGDIGSWAETLNANGFRVDRGGVGIMSAPYEDPGISSGKPIALRAWGTAWDCDEWDETVANAFVIENYGTRGIGPERMIAPFPDGVLAYEDRDVEDTPVDQAPTDGMDDAEELTDEELGQLEEDRDDTEGQDEAPDQDDDAPAEDEDD
jgi:hypothetical protein